MRQHADVALVVALDLHVQVAGGDLPCGVGQLKQRGLCFFFGVELFGYVVQGDKGKQIAGAVVFCQKYGFLLVGIVVLEVIFLLDHTPAVLISVKIMLCKVNILVAVKNTRCKILHRSGDRLIIAGVGAKIVGL